MATNKDIVKSDLQEIVRSVYTGIQIADGVRDEVLNTGEHLLDAITAPAKTAINQGPAATLSYVESLLPAAQIQNVAKTVVNAALGDEAAQTKAKETAAKAVDMVQAIPVSLGTNFAKGQLAGEAGNPHEFGIALGAITMTVMTGPEGKAVEAAAVAAKTTAVGAKDVAIDGVLVDSAVGITAKDAAATASLPTPTVLPATTTPVLSTPCIFHFTGQD
jgi:hypothetical protein